MTTKRTKPASKAPAKRKATTRKPSGGVAAKRADAAAKRAKEAEATGKRLAGSKRGLRDSMILARAAQGVPWPEIAKEAGITARSCQRVVEDARSVRSPLEARPMELVEGLLVELRRSIGDYESMAHAWFDVNQNAALGAKWRADETRMRMLRVLESVGKLPSNLEAFRSEMEMERIARAMYERLSAVLAGEASIESALGFLSDLIEDRPHAELGTGE